MAITGLTAFRCIEWDGSKWKSPARFLVWDSPVVWATCKGSPQCPQDEDGHIIIREGCHCGIHGTLRDDEFREYMNSEERVGLLVESLGRIIIEPSDAWERGLRRETYSQIWMHDQGFTASGVLVVGVINLGLFGQLIAPATWKRELSKQTLAAKMAADFFKCQILDYESARLVCRTMWEKYGGVWTLAD